MNAEQGTKEYHEGYRAALDSTPCPYAPGSTARMLWNEGYLDALDDVESVAEQLAGASNGESGRLKGPEN